MNIHQRLGKAVHTLTDMDHLMRLFLPYFVIFTAAAFILFVYYSGPSMTLDVIMSVVGVVAGVVVVYFIYRSLEQEKSLQFFEGEKVILTSTSPRTYAVITALGDKDISLQPIRANVYLTNMGIIAERPGTGEAALFIALDMINDFGPDGKGIRIRYADPQHPFAEAMIFVEERDRWLQTLATRLNMG